MITTYRRLPAFLIVGAGLRVLLVLFLPSSDWISPSSDSDSEEDEVEITAGAFFFFVAW